MISEIKKIVTARATNLNKMQALFNQISTKDDGIRKTLHCNVSDDNSVVRIEFTSIHNGYLYLSKKVVTTFDKMPTVADEIINSIHKAFC